MIKIKEFWIIWIIVNVYFNKNYHDRSDTFHTHTHSLTHTHKLWLTRTPQTFSTFSAFVRLITGENLHVPFQVSCMYKTFSTFYTAEWCFSCMRFHMSLSITLLCKTFPTFSAFIRFLPGMNSNVFFPKSPDCIKHFPHSDSCIYKVSPRYEF